MIELLTKGIAIGVNSPIVGVITRNQLSADKNNILITDEIVGVNINSAIAAITESEKNIGFYLGFPIVYKVKSLSQLDDGDIVVINPNGKIRTLYRAKSHNNSLFITERCNSNCLMCSQPPINRDDLDYHYNNNIKLIKLLPKSVSEIGITGGEPTLLGDRFFSIISLISQTLPDTSIHVLTNGRSFAWNDYGNNLLNIDTRNLIFGIPLYSDYYLDHDYIVQSKNAFDQTIIGLHNLARLGIRIEIRIVLHKLTTKRLFKLAKFIQRNLPFVEHIAFMGLEYTGYTPYNDELLWIEPQNYIDELEKSIDYLHDYSFKVSIYNLQLCLLNPNLWKYAVKSISAWKVEYLEECTICIMKDKCGGVFATSKKISQNIKAIV